jgi:hypothetical protein
VHQASIREIAVGVGSPVDINSGHSMSMDELLLHLSNPALRCSIEFGARP